MTSHPNRSKRLNLANRIAFLETDIGTMTADEEARRMSKLQAAWAEYGDEDEVVRNAISSRSRMVAQAQRDGEYDNY
jgi:hypothetical protein